MERFPMENIIGSRRPGARSVLGNCVGWSICALGVFILFNAYTFSRKGRSFSNLIPHEAGVGLYIAVCGLGLAKRYALALWLTGALVLALLALAVAGLLEGELLYALVPGALFVVTGAIFGYFFGYGTSLGEQDRKPDGHSGNSNDHEKILCYADCDCGSRF